MRAEEKSCGSLSVCREDPIMKFSETGGKDKRTLLAVGYSVNEWLENSENQYGYWVLAS